MSIKPESLKYLDSHEWVSVPTEGSDIATVGISEFAVTQLNDLVFMSLPSVGQEIRAGDEFGEVESVKAVSPMYCPVSGTVVEIHDGLPDQLEILNQDPYNAGWIMKIRVKDESEFGGLLDWQAYKKLCDSH